MNSLGLVAIKKRERLYTQDDIPRCPSCGDELGTAPACCGWRFQQVNEHNVESVAMSDLARSIMVPVQARKNAKRKRPNKAVPKVRK